MTTLSDVLADYPEVRGVHPAADLFPMQTEEQFREFAENVRIHGLSDPIVLTRDGLLLDGRNRLLACALGRVEPRFTTYNGNDPTQYVLQHNLHRRDLNVGQRAMIALAAEALFAEEAKERQRVHGWTAPGRVSTLVAELPPLKSREQAAKSVGVSARAVQQAKAVKRDAPDLAEQVQAGDMALDAAAKIATARKKVNAQPAADPAPKAAPEFITLLTHDGEAFSYPKPQGKATFNETRGDGISWASWSWNPVTGCLHGCTYCYAREIATSDRFKDAYPAGFTPLFHPERLDAPRNTTIPVKHQNDPSYRRVFVCSMADLYGQWVPEEWINQVHASMLASPEWEYLLLTKFPSRYTRLQLPANAWVGTSVDEQARVRIAEDAFRKIEGVKVKWLSLEPLRTPLKFTDLSMFDWVVIGAQTATRQPDGSVEAFSPPWEWVIDITKQALDAGCKVHWKPNLREHPGMIWPDQYPDGVE